MEAPLFQNKEHPLSNIFSSNTTNCMNIRLVIYHHHSSWSQDHILGTESPKKHTFTQYSDTSRDQNNKVKQLEEINRNALQALKARGITVQTSPYPLALATMNGCARTGSKSTFRTILQQQPQFAL